MFTKDFDRYVVIGDYITCEVDGFTARATLYHDEDNTPPDRRIEGFWPSLDPKDAGYIGPKTKRTLARARARARKVMTAWENDEWHYYGVAVTIWKDEVCLTGEFDHALWGIEGNWPGGGKNSNPNIYFREVANDYLPVALIDAKTKLAKWAKEGNPEWATL